MIDNQQTINIVELDLNYWTLRDKINNLELKLVENDSFDTIKIDSIIDTNYMTDWMWSFNDQFETTLSSDNNNFDD